ncbi:3-isopropylmalate dehydratase small subunit [Halorubrum ezzemoulense]|uniref:3-isopropylmalate dehydratase n=2 Tax=Halorubrum ezzemoulense TaxID=337243 RepID=A0A256KBJ2_HALEZ|nr:MULTISPECIES: 3-isopropylmalate dehydratase small subunit [Halorubrum]MDB2236864.1 3-isopropylmalate dehydratase small subunit [Halorubrum ezzemoulense]MDB2242033.1 3-isopropylmalate dehydratase small subunit [Halorubrum ezzemoulense]MDB2244437.1 3-isopropylmalate dehydratase small subunit [Halorubrum ezzemoulense]MDB2247147.1 3-isopropylmalate dehydratase small subunit [Halorubrum ezzemoulense]MDB2250683.1 3-isopropylmalate dehydratase small subunit [Halorubrum ezzemoulense]
MAPDANAGDDQHITEVSGTGVPIPGDDVDTDQILPAQFMKEVTFDNMADYLFYDARRDEDGEFNDHPLNRFEGASIAVVNSNFGCGSSREHAPQAMMRWGVDGVVGESYAEIFRDNCKSLGIPAVTADHETVVELQEWIEANPDGDIEVDVEGETVTYGDTVIDVEVDDAMREALVEGIWDTTALMYSNRSKVDETVADLPYVEGDD